MKKYLNFVFINIVIFGIFSFLFSLLIPSKVKFNKTNQALGDKAFIRNKLMDTNTWSQWHVFYQSNTVKIKNMNQLSDSTFSYELTNDHHKQNHFFTLVPSGNTTIINWQCQEDFGYMPWNKLRALGAEKQLKEVVDSSLQRFVQLQ